MSHCNLSLPPPSVCVCMFVRVCPCMCACVWPVVAAKWFLPLFSTFFLNNIIILWEFPIIYLYHSHLPSPTPLRSNSSLYPFNTERYFSHIQSSLCYSTTLESGGLSWTVVDMPGDTPLKKTDFPPTRNHQMSTASQMVVGFHTLLLAPGWGTLACVDHVHAVPITGVHMCSCPAVS